MNRLTLSYKFFLSAACLSVISIQAWGQSQDQNYRHTTTYLVPSTNGDDALDGNPLREEEVLQQVNYFDGLGRTSVSVQYQSNPKKRSLYTFDSYDDLGRKSKTYLPWITSENHNSMDFIEEDLLETGVRTLYSGSRFQNTMNPYSETRFDNTPMSRPIEQGAPGNDWEIDPLSDTDHTIKTQYELNILNDNIWHLTVHYTNDNYYTPTLQWHKKKKYGAGALTKTITRDENWDPSKENAHTTITFKNKKGQIILKRHFSDANNKHDTYYVYDRYNNLVYVLSPEASEHLEAFDQDPQFPLSAMLNDLAYQYIYDYRNRLVEKKVPGKDWEYIVYDYLDRPILTQDHALRQQNRWLFTKYDPQGRIAYTGWVTSQKTRSELQLWVGPTNNPNHFETPLDNPIQVDGQSLYYSNTISLSEINNITLLSVMYYDRYVDTRGLSLPSLVYEAHTTEHVNGLPTVTHTRVLESTYFTTSLIGYDYKGRTIYTAQSNPYLNTVDETLLQLDFVGKTLEQTSLHKKGSKTIEIKDYFTYDPQGRVLLHEQQIDNEEAQLIAKNEYDDLGRLLYKEVGGATFIDGYTDITNVNVSQEGVIEKRSLFSGWNAGLKTKGKIKQNGGIQARVKNGSSQLRMGLVKTESLASPTTDGWDYYDFGIQLERGTPILIGTQPTLQLTLILDGQVQPTPLPNFTYTIGDVFKIERVIENGAFRIEFIKNEDAPFFTYYDNTATKAEALTGKIGLYNASSSLEDLFLYAPHIDHPLQKIDYKYNVRGWLTAINDVEAQPASSNDLFAFSIGYNTAIEGNANGVTPLYNGNISQTIWRTKNTSTTKRAYGYLYDGMNRLTGAISKKGESLTQDDFYNLGQISYDKNGNLLTLQRYGTNSSGNISGLWDNLYYNYYGGWDNNPINTHHGNQLREVYDLASGTLKPEGFKDDTSRSPDYTYDANGNLISDKNKGITSITYNFLNLPERINFNSSGTNYIIYTYDATGQKLRKREYQNNTLSAYVDYAGNFNYQNGVLQFFNHAEGYVQPLATYLGTDTDAMVVDLLENQLGQVVEGLNNDLLEEQLNNLTPALKQYARETGQEYYSYYNYVFQYKDHLGNVRLSYADSDGDGTINPSTEIIEESNYYPFGLKQKGYNHSVSSNGNSLAQKFKYQGQELEEELGKNTYAFQWRDYDPAIGRFGKSDRFAEKYYPVSNYAFTANNPILFREIKGDTIRRVSGSEEFKEQFKKDLQVLREDETLGKIVKFLESHEKDINVEEAFSIIGSIKDLFKDGSGDRDHVLASETNRSGSGVDVDYSQIAGVDVDGVESESSEILAHELTHAFDLLDGKEMRKDNDDAKELPQKERSKFTRLRGESRAVHNANILRSKRGKKLRTNYNGVEILKKVESFSNKKRDED
ncbi:MAG: DUF6443 domain-containing protein [Candidatus Pacebacteria bacterium]|nr:DUF6443 domain-containing protein [Candidatus Paceibacterota bacterium]